MRRTFPGGPPVNSAHTKMPVGAPIVAYQPRARFHAGAAALPFAASAAEPPSAFNATLVRSAKDVFAGTMGGVTVTLLGHPFDTVKVLLRNCSRR